MLSTGNNTSDYFALLEQPMNDVLVILDDWYSLKLEEAESYKEKKEDTSVGMSAKQLIDLGLDPEEVLEVAEL